MIFGLTQQQLVALAVFVITYMFIALGWKERTVAAIVGVVALWLLGVLSGEDVLHFVDFYTLELLFGMMVIVGALREAGFFRWIAIYLVNLCKCDPKRAFFAFTAMTALLSAFLDNVTTVLFMVTVTIEMASLLGINPIPMVVSLMVAANIGGTATLVGDPPNIMIASASGLTFTDFLLHATPTTIMAFFAAMTLLYLKYRSEMKVKVEITRYPYAQARL